jgi:hypothetical protein
VLADAEVELPAGEVVAGDRRVVLELGAGVAGEIRATPEQARELVDQLVDDGGAGHPSRELLAGLPRGQA